MPTFRKYTDGSGYYIRSNIDGSFLTMQLSAQAEGLLTELGYEDSETIVWPLLHPLCDSGDVYTNRSGTEVSPDHDQVESSLSSDKLSTREKERVKAFLAEDCDSLKSSSEPDAVETTERPDPESVISQQSRPFIRRWSNSQEEYKTTLDRVVEAPDPDGISKSVNQHTTHHPIQPNRFQVSSRGVPVYSFETAGIPWVVHHFEPLEGLRVAASMFVEIRPGTSDAQSITVGPEETDWHTTGDRFSPGQIDDFLAVFPDVLYYYHYHPNTPSGDPYTVIEDPSGKLPSEQQQRVDAFDDVRGIDLDEYGHALGVVISTGSTGHGRLRTHTGHTFPYSSDHVEGGTIEVGHTASFQVTKYKHGYRARDIRSEEIDEPTDRIISEWPSLKDLSLAEVFAELTEPSSPDDVSTTDLRFDLADDDVETISVEVNLSHSVQWILRIREQASEEALDSAIRETLKSYIDGTVSEATYTGVGQPAIVTLPTRLHEMISSIVNTSDQHDSVSEFVAVAVEEHLGAEDQEISISISGGQYEALRHVAQVREQSSDSLVEESIECFLEDAPELDKGVTTSSSTSLF